MTPAGTFPNIPNSIKYSQPTKKQEASLTLTLEKIKDSLKEQLKNTDGATVDDNYVEKFLYEFTSLLVDYRDMRNYIFFGSANTEIAYNLKYLINNFPYKFFIGEETDLLNTSNSVLQIINDIPNNQTSFIFNETAIKDGVEQFNFFDNITDFDWSKYEIVDTNQNRYSIKKTISPYIDYSINQYTISSVMMGLQPAQEDASNPNEPPINVPAFNTLQIVTTIAHGYSVGDLISLLDIQIDNGATSKDISDEYVVSNIVSSTSFLVVNKNKYSDIKIGRVPRPSDSISIPSGYSLTLTGNAITRKYATVLNVINISTDTNPATIDYSTRPETAVPAFDTMKITTNLYHGFKIGEVVSLLNVTGLQDEYVVSYIISDTEFLVVNKYKANIITNGGKPRPYDAITLDLNFVFVPSEDALVRKYSADLNATPYVTKLIIKGNFLENYLITNTVDNISTSGFIISPTKTVLSEFEFNLTDIQRMLLSPAPINPTPWPRRSVTNNIQNLLVNSNWNTAEVEFINWIQDPNFLYLNDGKSDDDIAFADMYDEYKIVRALALDETTTNQLIRRCIPSDIISEIYDTPNADFKRFILIAGWFFDQIKLYIDFLKYTHHINTSDFNQLSPEYYKYYAAHYGLDLFTDDGIDFSKLVIQTEPGLYFRQQGATEQDSKFYQFTLQQLQYERQKRLLLGLFFLYKTKGTQGTIEKLVSLLGAPDGFFLLSEYAFSIDKTDDLDYYDKSNMKGTREIDNEKVYVPNYIFEKDPDYPVPNGMPPVYRMRLDNESTFNLRQIAVQTNPNGAIDAQIENIFGQSLYYYGKFNEGEFANLQSLNTDFTLDVPYYFLPLSIPDKFIGMTIEYMIPQDGYDKGVGNNTEEANIILCSLYQIGQRTFDGLTVDDVYTYPVPVNYSNKKYTSISDMTDLELQEQNNFSTLQKYFKTVNFDMDSDYIICRIEGNDLVVRLRLNSETGINNPNDVLDVGERVAILENVFSADGLNHTLRLLMRPEGIEVYQDYKNIPAVNGEFLGVALWRNPLESSISTEPFRAFEIPKDLISSCNPLILSPSYYETINSTNTSPDSIRNWDMLVGLPSNLDVYFKRVSIFENYAIDSYDEIDRITNDKNYNAEYWSFSFKDNDGDDQTLKIRCEFSIMDPNINSADYSYVLPVEGFNNKVVVKDMSLSSKQLINTDSLTTKYFYKKQSFFEVEKIFEQNAWQKDIHSAYEYDNFSDKVVSLYNLYSPQVLTYDSLASFLDLIENKFRPLIQSFIPIVVNISEFGRLIKNSKFVQPKAFYKNVHKACIGQTIGKNAILQFRLYDLIPEGIDFNVEIMNGDNSDLIPPIPISWDASRKTTEYDLLQTLRNPTINPYKLYVYLNDGMFSLAVDAAWYTTTYSQNPNDLKFIITYTQGLITQDIELNFNYAADTSATDNSCASIEYKLPTINKAENWIYYNEENQKGMVIYYDNENQTPTTYLNYKN